jgi:hypothetical protein
MEQTIQKPLLPIKTKIAAKWLRIYSIVYLIFAGGVYILTFPLASMGGPSKLSFLGFLLLVLFPLFILLFASGILRGKRWAWWGTIILLSIIILIPIVSFIISVSFFRGEVVPEDIGWLFLLGAIHSIFVIIPFILLLLDRKNF